MGWGGGGRTAVSSPSKRLRLKQASRAIVWRLVKRSSGQSLILQALPFSFFGGIFTRFLICILLYATSNSTRHFSAAPLPYLPASSFPTTPTHAGTHMKFIIAPEFTRFVWKLKDFPEMCVSLAGISCPGSNQLDWGQVGRRLRPHRCADQPSWRIWVTTRGRWWWQSPHEGENFLCATTTVVEVNSFLFNSIKKKTSLVSSSIHTSFDGVMQ